MAQIDQRPNYCDFITEIRYAKCGNKFLLQIEELIDWRPINAYLNRKYTKTQNAVGHPAYPAPLMFKILLLGIWYSLSDEALEERINDAISFSRFLGISMDKKAPDHSTISRFRSTLVKLEIMEKLLDLINKQLKKKHLLTVKGVIVDASIVESPNTPSIIPDYEVADDRSDDRFSEEKEKEEKAHQKYKLDNDGDPGKLGG